LTSKYERPAEKALTDWQLNSNSPCGASYQSSLVLCPEIQSDKHQAPSIKHQNAKQKTSSKLQVPNDGKGSGTEESVWRFRIFVCLRFGACDLEFRASDKPA
jgi:hypothetical protein